MFQKQMQLVYQAFFFCKQCQHNKRYITRDAHICNFIKVVLNTCFLQLTFLLILPLQKSTLCLGNLHICSRLDRMVNIQRRGFVTANQKRHTLSCLIRSRRSMGTFFHFLLAPTHSSGWIFSLGITLHCSICPMRR